MGGQEGFIHVEEIDGVWWLVNAKGERFVTVGVNHVSPAMWLAPYNREATLRKYGKDFVHPDGRFNPDGEGAKQWFAGVLAMLDRWRFNTLGMHTHGIPLNFFKDKVYHVASTYTAQLAAYNFKLGEDRFPDIFSDAFGTRVADKARQVCKENKNEPNLIGYAFIDTPCWVVPHRLLTGRPEWKIIHPWVGDLRALDAEAPGKQAWIGVLKNNHASATDTAKTHGLEADTWEKLAAVADWPAPAKPELASRDNTDMLGAIAERWYSVHCKLIRQHDPNHLILGDKLENLANFPDWLLPIVKKYVDVVFIQAYSPFDLQQPHLIRLYEAIGKPIINGDSSFGVPKPPHQTHVKGWRVKNLKEMGEYYYAYLEGIMSLPFMLGWHHCGFMEQWDGAKPKDAATANENGLMDPFEKPYEEVVTQVILTNRKAVEWHGGIRGQ